MLGIVETNPAPLKRDWFEFQSTRLAAVWYGNCFACKAFGPLSSPVLTVGVSGPPSGRLLIDHAVRGGETFVAPPSRPAPAMQQWHSSLCMRSNRAAPGTIQRGPK